MNTDELIGRLGEDLKPVQKPLQLGFWLPIWLLTSVTYVVAVTLLLGPMRPGFVDQLINAPRFSLEVFLGAVAVVAAATVCLAQSIPGNLKNWMVWFYRGAVALWLIAFFSAFISSPIEVSMHGKRDSCIWESFLMSTPPMLLLVYLAYRRYPLAHTSTALSAALAAGIIPAVTMQLACMYDPMHGLLFHVMPVAYLGAVCLVVSMLWRNIHRSRAAAT